MLNCKHLISSHADTEVCRPPQIMKFRPEPWKFTFLQHGVIKDDLSRWLNRKNIDLFITSTPGEHESIVGDETPYAFTTYEVKMTGLARFDRLRELGEQVKVADREYILVCPTWRHWLTTGKVPGTHHREIVKDFLDTQYAKMWLGFLRDERLREFAEREGLVVGFMPHPNIQPVLEDLELPPHVKPLHFVGQDVQRTFAKAAVMVTDYSSMAFNAAYIDRPLVYFQWDADVVHGGGHIGRYGYFDYARDGFGPVTETVDQAVAAVEASLKHGGAPAPEYLDRIRATFPERDGLCCARTVAAIEAMNKPVR
jgi:CDP-glycerol glycerophosphotransferase (TagB/SpsB family)